MNVACDSKMLHVSTESLIDVARGLAPADLIITNCRLVNVLSGEIHPADVAVAAAGWVGFGDYEAKTRIDAAGRYLAPGLIDGHLHVESTLLAPAALAKTVAPRGTAAIVCDPHEIANVLGLAGVDWMLAASPRQPVTFHVMMPSCVPATQPGDLGAVLDAGDIAAMLNTHAERMPGLAEMMNFPGVLFKDPGVLAKLEAAPAGSSTATPRSSRAAIWPPTPGRAEFGPRVHEHGRGARKAASRPAYSHSRGYGRA
jgi:adenine deaminase